MSIYSVSLKPISRSAGRSATAAAAYRLGIEIEDERTGEVHDYTRRNGVESTFNFVPPGVVELVEASKLWNAAEAAENRKNSTVARELLVALPHELSSQQRKDLARSISAKLAERYGVAGSVGIHLPDSEGDQRNYHAHIQFTTRSVDKDGNLGAKTRVLDDKSTGPEETKWLRKMVEEQTNTALEAAGLEQRVDSRSLKDQKQAALEAGDLAKAAELDRQPTVHLGPRVTAILREAARQGRAPLGALDRPAANDAIHINVDADKRELKTVNKAIHRLELQIKAHGIREERRGIAESYKKYRSRKSDICIELEKYDIEPEFIKEAKTLKAEMEVAVEAAKLAKDNPSLINKISLLFNDELKVNIEAKKAISSYNNSEAKKLSDSWHSTKDEMFNELKSIKTAMSDLVARDNELKSELSVIVPLIKTTKQNISKGNVTTEAQSPSPNTSDGFELATGVDHDGPLNYIQTGDPVADEFAREFASAAKRRAQEEAARIKANGSALSISPEVQKIIDKQNKQIRDALSALMSGKYNEVDMRASLEQVRLREADINNQLAADTSSLQTSNGELKTNLSVLNELDFKTSTIKNNDATWKRYKRDYGGPEPGG